MSGHSWDVLDRLPRRVPDAVAARLDARPPDAPVAAAEPSASVVLLRDGASGLETYLLHRHARMRFAASMVVFPGGRQDPVDAGAADPRRACAVRETAEETGVRLAPERLAPWAHWVTPATEPQRFDTMFYLAALPVGAEAADVSGETEHAGWRAPASASASADRGELGLLPPTRAVLLELAELPDVAAALTAARGRVVARVLPTVHPDADGGWRFGYPTRAVARG